MDDERPDPRLDPYRGRAGVLSRDGVPIGHLLVETQFGQFKAGGALWWTRWDPVEETAVAVWILHDGEADEAGLGRETLDEALAGWARGVNRVGPHADVSWLDQAESDRVHHEVFGHHH